MRGLCSTLFFVGIAAGAIGAIAGGCNGDTALPIEAQCNPLGINHCMTPWPNSAFELDDATTATGKTLAIPDKTLTTSSAGTPAAPMVMSFPGGVSTVGLPAASDMTMSTTQDSPTVVLDMTTGDRVAHFAEIDMQADDTPDSQALFIRPPQ